MCWNDFIAFRTDDADTSPVRFVLMTQTHPLYLSFWWRRHIPCTFRSDDADTSPVRFVLMTQTHPLYLSFWWRRHIPCTFCTNLFLQSSSNFSAITSRLSVHFLSRMQFVVQNLFYISVYYRPKHNICISKHTDEIWITSGLHVSTVKQPSSDQRRTYTR